jgi:hypothetical protein
MDYVRYRSSDILQNQDVRNSSAVFRVLNDEIPLTAYLTFAFHILPHRSPNRYKLLRMRAATISPRLLPSSLTSLHFRHGFMALIDVSKSDGPFGCVLVSETIAI